MNGPRFVKKGEILYREGDKASTVFVIQTGGVSITTTKARKPIEIHRSNMGQMIGEEILFGALQYSFTATAAADSNVIEIPASAMMQQIETLPQLSKLLLKSQGEKLKALAADLKNLKTENEDELPCPPENTAKVFGVIFHLANFLGTKKDEKVTVKWPQFKKYAQRVFLESPIRLEQAMYVLVKLKMAELQMVKNETDPDGPDELGFFHLSDLSGIERFFDFYQNYQFKAGGGANILKYDEKCFATANLLSKLSEGQRMDQKGVVYMNYKETLDKMKAEVGPSFTPDSISRLEQKGLFVKRDPNEKGGTISFFKSEFDGMIQNWKILREIEKWNEKGQVDLVEEKPKPGAQVQAELKTCPSCLSQITDAMKFCPGCGGKLK